MRVDYERSMTQVQMRKKNVQGLYGRHALPGAWLPSSVLHSSCRHQAAADNQLIENRLLDEGAGGCCVRDGNVTLSMV